jgi:hypothetical protein
MEFSSGHDISTSCIPGYRGTPFEKQYSSKQFPISPLWAIIILPKFYLPYPCPIFDNHRVTRHIDTLIFTYIYIYIYIYVFLFILQFSVVFSLRIWYDIELLYTHSSPILYFSWLMSAWHSFPLRLQKCWIIYPIFNAFFSLRVELFTVYWFPSLLLHSLLSPTTWPDILPPFATVLSMYTFPTTFH